MYSTHNEGKSIVPEINIRTLKNIWLMNLQIYDLHIKKMCILTYQMIQWINKTTHITEQL